MGMCFKPCNRRVYNTSGFLLMEVIVAFFIVCLCLGILLSQISRAHHLAYKAKKVIEENDILEEIMGSFIIKRSEVQKERELEVKLPEIDIPFNISINTISILPENYDEALRKRGEIKRYEIEIKLNKKVKKITGYL